MPATNNILSEKQEKEWVGLLKNGSHAAFSKLYARYKDELIYSCMQYLKDISEAEDVVQDIFMQVWETRNSINTELSFSGYIHTLARNRILNIYRQFSVHSRFVQHILDNGNISTNETEDLIIENDYTVLLNKMMDSLSPQQREVFRLSRIEGLSYKEISERLQISVPTVQTHAYLALKKIKDYLKKHFDIHVVISIIAFFLSFF